MTPRKSQDQQASVCLANRVCIPIFAAYNAGMMITYEQRLDGELRWALQEGSMHQGRRVLAGGQQRGTSGSDQIRERGTRAGSRGDVVLVLFADSNLVTDNMATVLEVEIDRVIGGCSNMAPVGAALRHTLAL